MPKNPKNPGAPGRKSNVKNPGKLFLRLLRYLMKNYAVL